MSYVFISHSTQDAALVREMAEALHAAGLETWIASEDVPAGQQYPEAIIGAIRDASAAVLVLTRSANSSAHVHREVELIANTSYPMFVIRCEAVPLADNLQYFLSLTQWVDATTADRSAQMRKLVEHVQRSLAPGEKSLGRRSEAPPPMLQDHDSVGRSDRPPAGEQTPAHLLEAPVAFVWREGEGLALDTAFADSPGSPVTLWPLHCLNHQLWVLEPQADHVVIRSVACDLVVTAPLGPNPFGRPITLEPWGNFARQQWRLDRLAPLHTYSIISCVSGGAVDVSGDANPRGLAQLQPADGGSFQHFNIVRPLA